MLQVNTLMMGPLGVLAAWPVATTTEAEDVDDGLPEGAGGMAGSGHHRS
jgi:hypothetical protein